ncbi:MAG: hypothetical protein AAGI22_23985 [Planctomycetota bacterium]
MLAFALTATLSLPAPLEAPKVLDFDEVPRAVKSEPAYTGEPRYGLFLFGEHADRRVWAVLDQSDPKSDVYDVLYLDRNANGVVGEEDERIEGEEIEWHSGEARKFAIGNFVQPGTKRIHTDFEITWTEASVRFKMKWDGEEVTMGGYGPTRDTYASFGESRDDATIYVPGYDRPLEFEHWMCGTLDIGSSKSFKVFVGARGSKRGAFSCGKQTLLPEGEYVLATLIYTDTAGKEQRIRAKLRERC